MLVQEDPCNTGPRISPGLIQHNSNFSSSVMNNNAGARLVRRVRDTLRGNFIENVDRNRCMRAFNFVITWQILD